MIDNPHGLDTSTIYDYLETYLNKKVNFFRRGVCIIMNATLQEIQQTPNGPLLVFYWHNYPTDDARREEYYNLETDTIALNTTDDPIDKDTDVALPDVENTVETGLLVSQAIRHDAIKQAAEIGRDLGYHSAVQYKELAGSLAKFVEFGTW